jgi:hypothetical protein
VDSTTSACSVNGCKIPIHAKGWCRSHYMRWWRYGDPLTPLKFIRGLSVADRFWSKVDRSGECWIWTGSLVGGGYGMYSISQNEHQIAHRFAWESVNGPIPEGLELDHTCHSRDAACVGGEACLHRRCVRPAHLEPVTPAENNRRTMPYRVVKTNCRNGHEFIPQNTGRDQNGHRYCRTCSAEATRRHRRKLKGAA